MPNTPDPQAARLAQHLRDARRRVQSTLVANADRLSTPFTDDPGKNPWDTFVRPAMRELKTAVDAVCEALAAVPSAAETTNRAALLREAADTAESLRQFEPTYSVARSAAQISENVGILRVADELRRNANEAEFAATPCSPVVPCEDGGEPCDVHERLLGHYDDSHELCAPDCGTADGPSRVAAEEQPAEAQDGDRVKAIADAIGPVMLLGLQDAELFDEPGQERIRDWIKWISETVAALPAPELVDRAAVLEEAAQIAVAENQSCPAVYQCQPCLTRERIAADLLRAAAKERPAVGEQPDTQTREARVVRCSAVMLRVHHAPHGWEPQPGMEPVHCPGYPQPAP